MLLNRLNKRSASLHSPKQLKQKRKKKIMFAAFVFVCVIVILGLIVLVLRFNFLQINKIEVKGTALLSSVEMQEKAFSVLREKYLYLIPKSNVLLYPKDTLEKVLRDSYKKIDSMEIRHNSFRGLEILVEEKVPTALVCEGFHEENVQEEDCYFADETGYVFGKAPQFSTGVYLRYYIVTDIGDSIIGTNFIAEELFKDLQKFAEAAQRATIDPLGILIGSQGDFEMYSRNSDGSEMITYFNDRYPFEKTSSNLIAFWNDSKIKKKGATTTPIFDSLNLRFGNNVFYVTK